MQNGATGGRYTAVRGAGAWLDGVAADAVEHDHASSARWWHSRAGRRGPCRGGSSGRLGSAALALCDVAAGHIDGYLDGLADQHAPWDYLGGLLVCIEAGATVVDAEARDLVVLESGVRRQLVAGGTPELVAALHEGLGPA